MIQSAVVNSHSNECRQEFYYSSSAAKLDRCVGSCSTFNSSSNKVCFPNKTEDLDLIVFNMITGIMNQKY